MGNVTIPLNETGNPVNITISDGAVTFLGLTDTPSSYSGQGLKFLGVNSGENGISFVSQTSSTVDGGTTDIDFGSDSVTVSGLGLDYDPSYYSLTIIKPQANSNNVVCNLRSGYNSDGFTADFFGSISESGYKLGYTAIR